MAKIAHVIDNVHMGLAHQGLCELAKKLKVDPAKLHPTEVLMFLNRKRDKLKVMGHNGLVIGYLKAPDGSKLSLEALQWLPGTFVRDGRLDYPSALKESLISAFKKRNRGKVVEVMK